MENHPTPQKVTFSMPSLILGICGCLLLGSVFGGSVLFSQASQSGFSRLFGVWPAGVVEESHEMPIGYDLKGKDKARKKVSEQRQLLSLPAHYGSLVGVTGSGQQAVLWYQDDMGVIRNVIIEADVIEPLRIDPKLTFKREADILRD